MEITNVERIQVLTEMGFQYQFAGDSHIITHPRYKGLFINHTSLMCAMQRIPTVCNILGRAEEKFKQDVKTIPISQV